MFQIKKTKNISHDVFGTKEGRIHIEKQNISRIQIKKMKGLKRSLPVEPPETSQPNATAPAPTTSKKSKRNKNFDET